jgi:hypothetical protein
MTKEEIIKIIVVALIGSFSKSIFDNILGKYIPDKKKLNSYIRKFFLFALRYILPMYFLIGAFLSKDPINKNFVFVVSIFTTVIFFNILIDIFSFYKSAIYKNFHKNLDSMDRVLNSMDRVLNLMDGHAHILKTLNTDFHVQVTP